MKNYLVTGGSAGIGRAVIKELINSNHKVINLDISKPSEVLENETFIQLDLSDYRNIAKYIPADIDYHGVFLNVGIHRSGTIFSQSFDDIENIISINLLSNIAVIKALENNLAKGCSIVFNGSDQSLLAKQHSFGYGMTKGAIGQITKSLALDLASRNIRVNTVCPGTTDTPLYRNAIDNYAKKSGTPLAEVEKAEANEFPIGRIATAEEIANVVIFLLSEKSAYMTGSLIPVDGGYTAG